MDVLRRVEGADRLQRLAFGVRQHVELQIRAARLLDDAASDEAYAEHRIGVRVDVEAVADGRRQAGEVVLALAQHRRAGRTYLEAVLLREVRGDRQLLIRALHRRGVDELGHRHKPVRGRRIGDCHRCGVPDFGESVLGHGQHLADLHRRHAVGGGPLREPCPRRGRRAVLDVRGGRRWDLRAVHPADDSVDGKLVVAERRAVEARLERVRVDRERHAVATRPHLVLAVDVRDRGVVGRRERNGDVAVRAPARHLAYRPRRQHQVADRHHPREIAVRRVRFNDAVGLHRALAVARIHDHDDRIGESVLVEVVSERPDDVFASVRLEERVLLVGVEADRALDVLVVDFGRDVAFRC